MLNRYYRDELNFLRLQGREFAEAHPQLSRFLSERSADPDVERLLEGFAFLTGRMQEKVEDEFPELTHSLISLLWPNYLRPVPSATIVRFDPKLHALNGKQTIAQGTALLSEPVDGTACEFRTCRDVTVYPITHQGVEAEHSQTASVIELKLGVHSDQPLHKLGLESLRLHMGGDNYTAQTLLLWLNHHLGAVEVEANGQSRRLPASAIAPVGFKETDALLPYPRNAYQGYRILQEYLCFPETFLFFDINELSRYLPREKADSLTLRFRFTRTLPVDARVRDEHFQLYCAPAINLFDHDGEPVDLDGEQTEYRVRPNGRKPAHFEVFSVERVQGWLDGARGRGNTHARQYTPFESFQHQFQQNEKPTGYFRVRVRNSARSDGFDHHIAFVRDDEEACLGMHEAISLKLKCTNRQLPERLTIGDITTPTESSPTFATFRNITRPSLPLRPTLDGRLLWHLISNLSLNYSSLLDRDALSAVLSAYDFKALIDRQAEQASRLRLQGILSIDTAPVDRMYRGRPVRGIRSVVTLDQNAFASEGDLYLFGTVLAQFFALYASINAFHELHVINHSNQERYQWAPLSGQQPLI
ncbi:type VI secretion system baseplate subunit TssF [Larsenimonas suaedae]|uniref:Type VI secretion system baseplate subunit TssF n=1 Tax=Larsenimonas suaedae TaxID=1851019 RepID=A0ABU1GW99_9GAMM|nr:type VI secretion system baseplate subunit TssF [Larsenimonas suaedae]MCM2973202.1 type VI secretion system baseplate subunit TssF [Larsenimonas suaedae]MDR5896095.1 type VI secretion system baseplate subunit TssF [Larsenimonas suaedae]